jgi:hypothetical protein
VGVDVRSLSQCWAGSINENFRANGYAGPSYRFTDLFFQSSLFAEIRSIVLVAGNETAADRKKPRSWIIHVPPTCWRITLEIFLLVDDPIGPREGSPKCPLARVFHAVERLALGRALAGLITIHHSYFVTDRKVST